MDKIWIKDGKFTELSKEQIEKLDTDQLAVYTSDMNKSAIDSIKVEFKEMLENANKNNISSEVFQSELDKLSNKIEDTVKDSDSLKELAKQLSNINKSLEKQGLEIASLKEKGISVKSSTPVGLGTALKQQLIEQGFAAKDEDLSKKHGRDVYSIKGFKDARSTIAKLETKAAIDMTTALTYVPGTDTSIGYLTSYAMRDVLLNNSNDVHATDVFPVTPISDKYLGVVVEHTETDGTATTAENTAAGKSSFLLKTYEYKVFKINTYYHVSEENLEDIDQIEAKINRRGLNNLKVKFDSKVLSTSGDNSTDIRGLFATSGTTYTAFSAATYATTVKDANIINVIDKMKLQAINADQEVNMVILHPNQISDIENLKDADGNSLMDRSVKFDNMGNLVSIKGLFVMRNKQIATNTCAVMWSEAVEIGLRRDVEMVIGLDSDDLTTGMRTIVISMRAAFGTGKPSSVIYSSNITNDMAIIEKP